MQRETGEIRKIMVFLITVPNKRDMRKLLFMSFIYDLVYDYRGYGIDSYINLEFYLL